MHLKFFFDPIQKRALSRSLQLEAVYLEALQLLKNGYHSSSIVTAVLWSLDNGSFPHKDKPVGWILF